MQILVGLVNEIQRESLAPTGGREQCKGIVVLEKKTTQITITMFRLMEAGNFKVSGMVGWECDCIH
jgi:hypothetical protein